MVYEKAKSALSSYPLSLFLRLRQKSEKPLLLGKLGFAFYHGFKLLPQVFISGVQFFYSGNYSAEVLHVPLSGRVVVRVEKGAVCLVAVESRKNLRLRATRAQPSQ